MEGFSLAFCKNNNLNSEKLAELQISNAPYRGPIQEKLLSNSACILLQGIKKTSSNQLENDEHILLYLGNPRLRDKYINLKENFSLLDLFIQSQENFVESLKGDYLIFVFNKNSNSVMCFRDPLGLKPFYFFENNDFLIASSEIRQILSIREVDSTKNTSYFLESLTSRLTSNSETIYKNILRLAPGHLLEISNYETRIISKQILDKPKTDLQITRTQAQEQIRYLLTNSVVSEVTYLKNKNLNENQIACHLSGGIDSSLICTIASSYIRKLHSFSVSFKNNEGKFLDCDETSYSHQVAEFLKIKQSLFEFDDYDTSWINDEISFYKDYPDFPNGRLLNFLKISAKDSGIGGLLSGWGSDEIFSSMFQNYFSILKDFNLRSLLSKIKLEHNLYNICSSLVPKNLKKRILNSRKINPWFPCFLNQKLIKDYCLDHRLEKFSKNYKELNPIQEKSLFDMLSPFAQTVNELDERQSAKIGVFNRHPFKDLDLIEFVLSLPIGMLTNGIDSKYLLKESFKDVLPPIILNRNTKAEFSFISNYIVEKEFNNSFLKNSNLIKEGIIDSRILQKTFNNLDIWEKYSLLSSEAVFSKLFL